MMVVESQNKMAGGQEPQLLSGLPSNDIISNADATHSVYLTTRQPGNLTADISNYTSTLLNSSPADVTYIVITVTVLCVIVFLMGLVGNLLVIGVVSRNAEMHTPTNWFLVNLSIADLLILLICMPSAVIEMQTQSVWLLGNTMCKLVPYLEYTVAHSSVLTILVISFERYSAICYPLQVLHKCTKRRAIIIIISMWLVALLWAVPIPFFTYTTPGYHQVQHRIITECVINLDSYYKKGYLVSINVVFFALPFLLLVLLYGVIGCKMKQESHVPDQPQLIQKWRRRKQVIVMLIIVILLFFVCLLPMRIFSLWNLFSSPAEKKMMGFEGYMHFLSFSRVMFYLNSAVNPLIYNVVSTKFRYAFKQVICSRSYLGRQSSAMAMTMQVVPHRTSTTKPRMSRVVTKYGI